jgi:hypothetical protein
MIFNAAMLDLEVGRGGTYCDCRAADMVHGGNNGYDTLTRELELSRIWIAIHSKPTREQYKKRRLLSNFLQKWAYLS